MKTVNTIELVKKIISEQIGTDPDQINLEDSLTEELHMSAQDLSDLQDSLIDKGFEEEKINLNEVTTVSDLVDQLASEEEL